MEGEVTYRAYRDSDFPVLVRLIEDVWDYEAMESAKLARCLAELDLLAALRSRSFGQVAVLEGRAVGFLFGRRAGTPEDPGCEEPIRRAKRGLMSSPVGWILHFMDRRLDGINRSLLRRSGRHYDGELTFFALREDCRGRGVGAELFRRFCRELEAQGAGSFFVCTDTASSYGFYEHLGMTRRVSWHFPLPLWQKGGTDFYLYEMALGG